VVVTAQKRAENIQDVPIKVTAVTAASLADAHAATSQDLQFAIPALEYADNAVSPSLTCAASAPPMKSPNADASVATYVDGVYIAMDSAIITDLLGVDRVEVLEGPQGTLYGRNAIGGAINIVTLTPSDTPSYEFSATGGDYDRREFSGHISGPVTDNLFVGLYVAGQWSTPYMTEVSPPVPGTVTTDAAYGVRFKAVWEPNTWLRLTLSAEGTRTENFDDAAYKGIGPYPIAGIQNLGKYQAAADSPLFITVPQRSVGLREEIDLGWAHILGISNYHHASRVPRSISTRRSCRSSSQTASRSAAKYPRKCNWFLRRSAVEMDIWPLLFR